MDIQLLEDFIDIKIKLALKKEKNQEPSKRELITYENLIWFIQQEKENE